MAKISFRGKVKRMEWADGTHAYDYVKIPSFKRSHCDMNAFRSHPKYGSFANSDMFAGILGRIKREVFGSASLLKLNDIPDGVTVDSSGFLANISLSV